MLTAMKEAGIVADANLYHNDMPGVLHFGGYGRMDEDFPKHFGNYADICFELFGDLVKYWFTFDEPFYLAYGGRYEENEKNTKPYILGYHVLLAHAEAVKVYREKYQAKQGGLIGFNLIGEMFWPKNPNSEADKQAALRNLQFQIGWFWEPIMTGDYPEVMKERVGDRLPKFTPEQKQKLKGAADFFALNQYMSFLSEDGGHTNRTTFEDDINSTNTVDPNWKKSNIGFPIVPEGIHDLLIFIHETWLKGTNYQVFITENGVSVNEPNISASLWDSERIDFLTNYLQNVEKAINEGVNITKYFVWSLLDNFEWTSGLSSRFGLTRVEYGKDYKRIPKASLLWYSDLIKANE
jgi:beta-glucosidase/6-phospho-beta-glucosidase/beta-galactosidase